MSEQVKQQCPGMKTEQCPGCGGSGEGIDMGECALVSCMCNGTGRIPARASLPVGVPDALPIPAPAQDEQEVAAVIGFYEGEREPRLLSWNVLPNGEHRLYTHPAQAAPQELRIVLDGPPGPEAGRFVEVENAAGRSVNAGEWRERADGLWELVLHATQGGE